MTLARGVLAAVLAALTPLVWTEEPAAQGRQRSLYVSAVDATGKPVSDLGTRDFVVKEDNLTREILRVTPAEEPMQVAVLVDTSQAARDAIAHMREALPTFVTELTAPNEAGRKNQIAIIGIGERPTILSEYSSNSSVVQKGIDRIWAYPGSGMYLLDAIIDVSRGLMKREAERPILVTIATEGADFSNRYHDQALDPLKEAGAAFYALMIGQPDTSLRPESRERAIVLDTGPLSTGGYREQLLTSLALKPRLAELANQLTHQYRVTYSRPESLIPPEHITVSSSRPGVTARGTPVRERQVLK
jgi:hypothetical protein